VDLKDLDGAQNKGTSGGPSSNQSHGTGGIPTLRTVPTWKSWGSSEEREKGILKRVHLSYNLVVKGGGGGLWGKTHLKVLEQGGERFEKRKRNGKERRGKKTPVEHLEKGPRICEIGEVG